MKKIVFFINEFSLKFEWKIGLWSVFVWCRLCPVDGVRDQDFYKKLSKAFNVLDVFSSVHHSITMCYKHQTEPGLVGYYK